MDRTSHRATNDLDKVFGDEVEQLVAVIKQSK